jgi:hypothetical protein
MKSTREGTNGCSDCQLLPHMDVLMARERMEAWSGQLSTVNFLVSSPRDRSCRSLYSGAKGSNGPDP